MQKLMYPLNRQTGMYQLYSMRDRFRVYELMEANSKGPVQILNPLQCQAYQSERRIYIQ